MATEPLPFKCQKNHVIPKGAFDRMRNPAAGPGRVIPTALMKVILGMDASQPATILQAARPPKSIKNDATKPGWVILHHYKKKWNEELIIRLTDPRPASEFSHYPIALFEEIISTPYSPDNIIQLGAPISFTFFLAVNKDAEREVIFSAKCPVKGHPGKIVELYFDKSIIPPEGEQAPDAEDHYPKPATIRKAMPQAVAAAVLPGCQDEAACRSIAAAHSIRADLFQQCLDNFWGERPVPPAYVITWTVLKEVLDEHNVATEQVKMLWADDDFRNNSIDFGFEDKSDAASLGDPGVVDIKTNYSMEVFYGIRLLSSDSLIELRFYKGQNNDGTKTILIEGVGNGLSYYDISSDRP